MFGERVQAEGMERRTLNLGKNTEAHSKYDSAGQRALPDESGGLKDLSEISLRQKSSWGLRGPITLRQTLRPAPLQFSLFETPASSKVAISRMILLPASMMLKAKAAPVPSPSLKPRPSKG